MRPKPQHPVARLWFEPLEDRRPVSSVLDAILGGFWLASLDVPIAEIAADVGRAEGVSFAPPVKRGSGAAAIETAVAGTVGPAGGPEVSRSTVNIDARRTSLDDFGGPTGQGASIFVPRVVRPASQSLSAVAATDAPPNSLRAPTPPLGSAATAKFVGIALSAPVNDTPMLMMSTSTAAPSLTLTGDSFVPVNANKTNGSKWKEIRGADPSDGNYTYTPNPTPPAVRQVRELVGIPWVRDFDLRPMRDLSAWDGQGTPPAGAAITDPDLKAFTATLADAGTTQIAISVTYNSASEGGRIKLWKEATKETEIALTPNGDGKTFSGTLPDAPTSMFFVEGMKPSKAAEDITITISTPERQIGPPVQTVPALSATKKISVTPIVGAFSVTPKNPPTTTFFKRGDGVAIGMTSGRQSADGEQNAPNSGDIGAKFKADLIKSGVQGEGRFVQVITEFSNGLANNKAMTISNGLSMGWGPMAGYSLPLVDSFAGKEPFYDIALTTANTPDRHTFESEDTPAFGVTGAQMAGSTMTMFDLTFKATLNLVWKFASDNTVYSLADIDWQTVFRASLNPQGVLTVDAASVTSVTRPVAPATYIITNADPKRMSAPVFTASYERKF